MLSPQLSILEGASKVVQSQSFYANLPICQVAKLPSCSPVTVIGYPVHRREDWELGREGTGAWVVGVSWSWRGCVKKGQSLLDSIAMITMNCPQSVRELDSLKRMQMDFKIISKYFPEKKDGNLGIPCKASTAESLLQCIAMEQIRLWGFATIPLFLLE